jgi:hypothetical protein
MNNKSLCIKLSHSEVEAVPLMKQLVQQRTKSSLFPNRPQTVEIGLYDSQPVPKNATLIQQWIGDSSSAARLRQEMT